MLNFDRQLVQRQLCNTNTGSRWKLFQGKKILWPFSIVILISESSQVFKSTIDQSVAALPVPRILLCLSDCDHAIKFISNRWTSSFVGLTCHSN